MRTIVVAVFVVCKTLITPAFTMDWLPWEITQVIHSGRLVLSHRRSTFNWRRALQPWLTSNITSLNPLFNIFWPPCSPNTSFVYESVEKHSADQVAVLIQWIYLNSQSRNDALTSSTWLCWISCSGDNGPAISLRSSTPSCSINSWALRAARWLQCQPSQ